MRAVLFDLDGTLIDSFEAIRASVNHVRKSHGLDALDLTTVSKWVGNGLQHLMERTVPVGALPQNCELYLAHHPTVIAEFTTALPGVADTLRKLASLGVKLGVCSNKPLALTNVVLDCLEIARWFQVILGPESVPRRKPAPDMLLKAVEILNLEKNEVVYVGDMTVDIETAAAAGIRCWAIPTGIQTRGELEATGPDRILNSLPDLVELVAESRRK